MNTLSKFKVGQVWINDHDYKIKILDVGNDEIWGLWENGQRGSWKMARFVETYTLWEDCK